MPTISTDTITSYRLALIQQMEDARRRVGDSTLPENMRSYYAGYADALEVVVEQLKAMASEEGGTE